jgi:hypothetical protein
MISPTNYYPRKNKPFTRRFLRPDRRFFSISLKATKPLSPCIAKILTNDTKKALETPHNLP